MARLILLNGPPAIGKSTLARRYADDHPLALTLDIDVVRCSLGQWQTHNEAKLLARNLAAESARVHLRAGYDVVVPQLLGRPDFIELLEKIAGATEATFHEFLLTDDDAGVLERFRSRRAELDAAGEDHPQREIDPSDDEAVLRAVSDSLRQIATDRPNTTVVRTTAGDIEAAYQQVVRALPS